MTRELSTCVSDLGPPVFHIADTNDNQKPASLLLRRVVTPHSIREMNVTVKYCVARESGASDQSSLDKTGAFLFADMACFES